MWQRIQTVFLALAAIASILFLFLPISERDGLLLLAKGDILVTSLCIAIALIALFAISQFKDRKLQLKLCFINLILGVALTGASFFASTKFGDENFPIALGLPIAILICNGFARRNIKKDEDLVKSMDRFR
ncbi:MAG: DUF4293 domain-containing protein [Bacteroidetes bacterium]|nr:DUF4293 domain-containing protein [Bacteroidota bacterium]